MNLKILKSKISEKKEHRRHNAFFNRRRTLHDSLSKSKKRIIILSSDCTGGRIMRDFELPEYTPTINNWYSGSDFLKICSNPDYYFSQEVVFAYMDENNQPVGKIDDVEIHFGHSSGFDESLKKWQIGCKSYFRAKKKGDYEICVIMNDRNLFTNDMLNKFDELPYSHKVLFVHRKDWSGPNTFYMEGEDSLDFVDVMTAYENHLSIKRRYDRFDFYGWFVDFIKSEDLT